MKDFRELKDKLPSEALAEADKAVSEIMTDRIKGITIDAFPCLFDDAPCEDEISGLVKWLNEVTKKGAVYFHQTVDNDVITIVAFREVVPENSRNEITKINWDELFAND